MSKNEIIEICKEYAESLWKCKEDYIIQLGYTKEAFTDKVIEKAFKEDWLPKYLVHEGVRYFCLN